MRTASTLVALLLMAGGAGCDDPVEPDPGQVRVVVDAHAALDLTAAWIEIDAVYLQLANPPLDPTTGRFFLLEDGTSGWDLQFGAAFTVAEADDVPAGPYAALHLVIDRACVVTPAGDRFLSDEAYPPCGREDWQPLDLADGDSAHAMIPLTGFGVTSGGSRTIRLVIDAGDSFEPTASGWILDPDVVLDPASAGTEGDG